MLQRIFANASSARKTAITTRVLQLVMELCAKGIHVTKRDLFYTDVKLFKQQTESDDILDDAVRAAPQRGGEAKWSGKGQAW